MQLNRTTRSPRFYETYNRVNEIKMALLGSRFGLSKADLLWEVREKTGRLYHARTIQRDLKFLETINEVHQSGGRWMLTPRRDVRQLLVG